MITIFLLYDFFFFFSSRRRHTRSYGDWSSDVCSSDLIVDLRFNSGGDDTLTSTFTKALPAALPPDGRIFILTSANTFSAGIATAARLRSEERRVGKECRSGWASYH